MIDVLVRRCPRQTQGQRHVTTEAETEVPVSLAKNCEEDLFEEKCYILEEVLFLWIMYLHIHSICS